MGNNNKPYRNKGEKLNESQYVDKIINHVESDSIGERVELKKIYSLSNDEYFELLDYEVSLFNSLKGEVFDTSDPKWKDTGQYEFEFEIDSSQVIDAAAPKSEIVLFTQKNITVNVDVDVTGTVFLGSTMINNPGRDWELREAIQNRSMGHIIVSEIRDIIYELLEQRLPLLINLKTLDVCDIKIDWVTKLSNVDKNINEAVFINPSVDSKDFLEYVYNDLVENTKWRDASFSNIDLYDGRCQNLQIAIDWSTGSFRYIPVCLKNYLKGSWGLTDEEIKELFWGRYDKHIINMERHPLQQPYNLTESKEDIDKNFLDKVVNSLIGETTPFNKNATSVNTPFFVDGGGSYWILTAHRCREIGIVHPENYMVPSIISNHLKDVYSLQSIEEMEYVMGKYYFNIYNKYFRKFFDNTKRGKISDNRNTMNESSATFGGNENFLNKMVDFMVDDTELVELDEEPYIRIKFPFIKYSGRKLPHSWYEAVPRFPFIEGVVDNYGLTNDEAEYVLEKYSDKLRSRVFSIRKEISDRVNN
jgi:hypothetical protein